jgi:hypothetical protein
MSRELAMPIFADGSISWDECLWNGRSWRKAVVRQVGDIG